MHDHDWNNRHTYIISHTWYIWNDIGSPLHGIIIHSWYVLQRGFSITNKWVQVHHAMFQLDALASLLQEVTDWCMLNESYIYYISARLSGYVTRMARAIHICSTPPQEGTDALSCMLARNTESTQAKNFMIRQSQMGAFRSHAQTAILHLKDDSVMPWSKKTRASSWNSNWWVCTHSLVVYREPPSQCIALYCRYRFT